MIESAIPLFVTGAPRSGTTFFTVTLNRHPQVFVTNETRILSFLHNIHRTTKTPGPLLPPHPARLAFLEILRSHFRQMVIEFYRDVLDKTNLGTPFLSEHQFNRKIAVWGDKNPGYSDGTKEPGCLDFILDLFPHAKFVHVVRDPRSSIASYLKLSSVYKRDLNGCIEMWLSHAKEAERFFATLPQTQQLTVKHEEFRAEGGPEIFCKVEEFLALRHAKAPALFLQKEMKTRTPYRSPTTPVERLGTDTYSETLSPAQIAEIVTRTEPYLKRWNYV
ncbi:MAG: sulfotransferase [Alphaproteobacteria bacterium]|nr:sulfotransferase [Alphaproteobacteria bacterium]